MSCRMVHRHETEYMDGVLQTHLAKRVEAHLGSCPACRRRLEENARVVRLLGATPQPEPPEDLYARVLMAAARPPSLGERIGDTLHRLRLRLAQQTPLGFTRGLASGFAAAVMLFAVLVVPASLMPPEDVVPEPETAPLMRFAAGAHDAFEQPSLTVVGTVEPSGTMRIRSIATPVDLYYAGRQALGRPLEPVVILVFESIQVRG